MFLLFFLWWQHQILVIKWACINPRGILGVPLLMIWKHSGCYLQMWFSKSQLNLRIFLCFPTMHSTNGTWKQVVLLFWFHFPRYISEQKHKMYQTVPWASVTGCVLQTFILGSHAFTLTRTKLLLFQNVSFLSSPHLYFNHEYSFYT